MSQQPDLPPSAHQVPAWKFAIILAVVLGGVVVGTLLIIPRADRGRTRPAKAAPAPFFPRATNQIVAPEPTGTPPR
jgi:hypothetical protein